MRGLVLLFALLGAFALHVESVTARVTPQVSVGATATCVRDGQGRIHCWGDRTIASTPRMTDGREFTQIAVGGSLACALRSDRSLVCWGNEAIAQQTPGELFVQIDAGGSHACGVRADGIIRCWGNDDLGQTQVPPLDDFIQVAAGGAFSCGLRADGSVVCWGDDSQDQRNVPPESFTQISAGTAHACGITATDSQVICWGRSIAALDERMTAVRVVASADRAHYRATDFVQVSAGDAHTCALEASGHVACWGDNTFGQRDAPLNVTLLQISAGRTQTCGITRDDGRVVCWGRAFPSPSPREQSLDPD